MIWLATLLIREKWRKLLVQYGWAGCVSLVFVVTALASMGAVGAARPPQGSSRITVSAVLGRVWLAWLMMGLFIGRDFTWHIRLEPLKAFPVSGFARLYLISFLLSFVSFPLCPILIVLEIVGLSRSGLSVVVWAQILIVFGLFTASVRSAVSIVRTGIYKSSALSLPLKLFLCAVISALTGCIVASFIWPETNLFLPGAQMARVLSGSGFIQPVLFLAGFVFLFSIADFVIQRAVTYSGMTAPSGHGSRTLSGGDLMLFHSSWPVPLWRISLLGWLRNRNSVLLLTWGGLYGFCWMYFSKETGALDFLMFSWMVQLFHGYLRGNLLGVDQAGAWLYYMFPVPVEKVIRAKNQTLSMLQGCMVFAVLLPGLLHPVRGMAISDWLYVVCYAYSSILLGEILGSFFSVRFPEPIERSSQFSGGTTPGALIVPVVQVAFALLFWLMMGLTRRYLSPAAFWLELIAVPAPLWLVRSFLLPNRIQKTMIDDRETILAKLSVFSS